jgi:tetratricopeptide (TPR) repeat protein
MIIKGILKALLTPQLCKRVKDIPLELFLQRIHDSGGHKAERLLGIVRRGVPNLNHKILAEMSANKSIRSIVSTNQDLHIEHAYTRLRSRTPLSVCIKPSSFRLKSRLRQLFKLHGSIDDPDSIIATLNQEGRGLEPSKAELLRELAENFPLIIAGYSGKDLDIKEVFMDIKPLEIIWISRKKIARTDRHIFNDLKKKRMKIENIYGDFNLMFPRVVFDLALITRTPRTPRISPKTPASTLDLDDWISRWISDNCKPHETAEIAGRVYMHVDMKKSLGYFTKASAIATKVRDLKASARSLREIAEFQRRRGGYAQSRRMYDRMLKNSLRSDDKRLLGLAYYGFSLLDCMMSRYKESLTYSQKSIDCFKAVNTVEGEREMAHAWTVMAQTYRDRGQYTKAVQHDMKARDSFKKLGVKYPAASCGAFKSRSGVDLHAATGYSAE